MITQSIAVLSTPMKLQCAICESSIFSRAGLGSCRKSSLRRSNAEISYCMAR